MSFEVSTKVNEDVLVAVVTGLRNSTSVAGVMRDVVKFCEGNGLEKVLVDVREFKGHLSTFDAFFLVTRHFRAIKELHLLRKAAILDSNLTRNRHHFLESVAVNRGYNFKIFEDPDKAMEWLKSPSER